MPNAPKRRGKGPDGRVSPWVTNGIAVTVTGVWASSFIADILTDDYTPPWPIHAAFMGIVGAIFGFQIVRGRGDDE